MKKTLSTILFTLGVLLLAVTPRYAAAQTINGNVYGGGEMAKVAGSTSVTINAGLFGADIFGGGEGALNDNGTVKASADVSENTHVTINGGEFAVEYVDEHDPLYPKPFRQHYNIYGGGNIASSVGNSHLHITKGMISQNSDGVGNFLNILGNNGVAKAYDHEGQMYFCIFGGGYGKNTRITGNTWVDFNINGMIDVEDKELEDSLIEYQSYLDVIGGGFNGTVLGNTNVHVGGNAVCRNIYGGGLYATIGTQDDAEKGKTNVYVTGGNIDNVYGGGVMGDIYTSTNTHIGLKSPLTFDGRDYAVDNAKITILLSVYGGNDVSGKVPQANIWHNGGEIDQNLFGAGNGDYIGYYTPGLCAYNDGDNDNYYFVNHSGDTSQDGKKVHGPKGNTYKGRPQTGNVSITIAGNGPTDKASVLGQVFGGGNSCTVGEWDATMLAPEGKYHGDPHLVRDDPDYFLGGGQVNITIGNHVKIGRTHAELEHAWDKDDYLAKNENVSGLYMGCSGRHLATETAELTSNSYHHYYDSYTASYWPGFAVFDNSGKPLDREAGLAAFNAYLNNILIWSDNVNLSIANDVEDVWLSNFVGGGFRGSMKAHSDEGQFHYSLPRGVTIGHDVVGGAYNTDVVYRVYDTESDMHTYKTVDGHFVYCTTVKPEWEQGRDYHHIEYAEDSTITGIVRFYYDGGILSHDNHGSRRHGVFLAYGSGDDNVVDFSGATSEQGLRKHKGAALLYMDARCQLNPEIIDNHVHGGNVFGGCFESGTIDGDIWTDYRCYIDPTWYKSPYFNGSDTMFANAENYQQNFAMMAFGAGYGKNTSVKGDAYLRILYNKESSQATYPCLYNVFGGSFQGTVDGNTNIYYNAGQQGMMVGGVYGGGSQGYVAGKSFVELAGGYIANVYGGAREANIGRGVHVWAYDGAKRNWGDDLSEHDDAPLVVERMFGGSDVSGLIGYTADATNVADDTKRIPGTGWTANYTVSTWPEELYLNGHDGELRKFDSYIQIGGTAHSLRGYPLVGQIYAGGNGESTDTEHGHILPGIHTALIELNDGMVMEAFGGGNAATIYEQNYILTNGQYDPVSEITMPTAHLTEILKTRVLKNVPDCYTLSGNTFRFKPNNLQRLFGGNNVAEMNIQPKWNLKAGTLGKVYAGGNKGDMTYYNPEGTEAQVGQLNMTPQGLSISVESESVEIFELYGGCRMADVVAINADGDTIKMPDNMYGATVNISGGRIHNIYGGNDVAGNVYNGANVNIVGGILGNIYGAGNGDYIYQYDASKNAPADGVVEERRRQDGYPYFAFRGVSNKAAATDKLQAINAVRPNVAKAYLNIAGQTDTAYVTGAVYCGGNASTIAGEDAHTRFDIGANCVLNSVYMGSNGEQLTVKENVDSLCSVNEMNLNTAAALREYMNAVSMAALPRNFSISSEITNAYIGTFCLGGNRGSMTAAEPLEITIPSSVTIFNKIVGGCNQAYINYSGNSYTGGFITWNEDRSLPKIKLNIYAKFRPREMFVPAKTNQEMYDKYKAKYFLYAPIENATKDSRRLSGKYCNVYGGCYTRGFVNGDVEINIYSDMLEEFKNESAVEVLYDTLGHTRTFSKVEKQQMVDNNIIFNETKGRPVFSVFGGGYGANTVVYGNTHIRLLNNHNTIDAPALSRDALPALIHPSVNAIYGGGEQGKMIGTSLIHVADGTVYSNVVGGALNGSIYGNTEILVGYPGYWEVQKTGDYLLKRSNFTSAELEYLDGAGNKAVKQSIFLVKGDRINAAVYQAIRDWDASQVDEANIRRVDNKVDKDWADINILIRGGIYGGGYARENVDDGQTALANTVLKFSPTYNLSTAHPEFWTAENTLSGEAISEQGEYVYGGNSTIWVQDQVNAQNWGTIEGERKEHITISTETDPVAHSGKGGIFGDGHSSLVAAFRSAALEGYGYAEHPANDPKLLNTFQRFDILQIRDCSMKMYGQIDVAIGQNDPTLYSVSRISELMLNSHINDSTSNLLGTGNLNARNVIDFYNPVHFLGSITSEVTFKPLSEGGSKYHDVDGVLNNDSSYYDYKSAQISRNYDYGTNAIYAKDGCKEAFGRRNAGTAKNMIRIDDPEGRGMHLKVVQENNYAVNNQGIREEQSFYGPLSGVFEFELTHANARGGGYVYSNNLHQQTIAQSEALHPGTKSTEESFLQTSGNVFFKPLLLAQQDKRRYVYDDCYPIPYSEHEGSGELEKAHYWFVEGDGPTWCTYPQAPANVDGENKIITIQTAEELAWVYDYIDHKYDSGKETPDEHDLYPEGFAGWTIQLGNDINLEQLTILDQKELRMIWCPIADQKDTYFKGTFDGKGHKIDGMLLDVDFITTKNTYGEGHYSEGYDHYFGLFAKTQGATIQNVELSGALVRNMGGNINELVHIGTLITQVDGTTVVNCSVEQKDSIMSNQTNAVEAAAAFICHTAGDSSYISHNFATGVIEANAAEVTAPVSGFISRLGNNSKMEHCYSLVDVHAQQVAGLADTVQGGAFLEHSYYAGKLTRTNDETAWGAVLANAGDEANVKHCYYDVTKNPEVMGYRGADTEVFKQDEGYTSWSTYGLPTSMMVSAADGDVWRSCYDHGHTSEDETHPCEIDGDDVEKEPKESAWNKGIWTYHPGLYPILKTQELDCSALTTAYVMPTAASLDLTTHTDLEDAERWYSIDKNFQLPAYGNMTWSVANNTLLLDSVSNKAQNKVNAHLYLGGPDALSINCDDYHRTMQEVYVSREDINNPADLAWYDTLSHNARVAIGEQLYVDSLTSGLLRNKEVTNISKKAGGKYQENGFDGDLHVWNREGSAGVVTNPHRYKVNGTITYYTGYANPYLWHEVNAPFDVDSVSVYRLNSGKSYRIEARDSELAEEAEGGNFWLRSFANDAEILYGGSVFQQAWTDPQPEENYGHRPSVIRFPKTMIVDGQKYLAGDYWCYEKSNIIDGQNYANGGSEIRFHGGEKNTIYGTNDWSGHEDQRGNYGFRVYGNPTLGNIQLEGYYWMLESEKRDTTGVDDPLVRPEFSTDVAQWFSLLQDPSVPPFGIWLDGPEEFKNMALDGGTRAPLRMSPLHEKNVDEQYGAKEASFTASGCNGTLGVFSYIDQTVYVYDATGRMIYSAFVRANTGFVVRLSSTLVVVRGANSSRQVKVML